MVVWIVAAAAVLVLNALGSATAGHGGTTVAAAATADASPGAHAVPAPGVSGDTGFPAARTKTAGCVLRGPLQDPACTPGALNPTVTQATIGQTICKTGFAAEIRPPSSESDKLKQQVARSYGITDSLSHYEGDHLVPLELGGAADDVANFWDEPDAVTLGDGTVVTNNDKDQLENALKARVCNQDLALLDAQRMIATDWYAAWQADGRPGASAVTTSTTTTTTTTPPTTASPTTRTTLAGSAHLSSSTTTAPPATTASTAAACPDGSYVNVSGNRVCSPTPSPVPGQTPTAVCNDGSYSYSQHRQGTCSGHGGVKTFLVNLP